MKMKNYIEQGEKKAGTQKELANMLGISASYIRMVKAGQKGFSIDMCIVLADYIEEDRLEVIAASNLITEKDEKKRKILESCFRKVASVAAMTIVTSIVTLPAASPVNASDFSKNLATYKLYAIAVAAITGENRIFCHFGSISF
jgi:hypothetical protein